MSSQLLSSESNDTKASGSMSTISSSSPEFHVELLNKEHNGNHFLKVLLLSNKVNKNKWVIPYKKISELPKQLIESYKGLPYTKVHDNIRFDKIYFDMEREGKSMDEIYDKYIEVSNEIAIGHVDHVYTDEDGEVLYGQVEVTDPEENEYIRTYGKPSREYTSPAMHGIYDVLDCGTMQYRPETAKAFHVAAVTKPAFLETEAKVKGICNKGSSELCRPSYASFDDNTPPIDPLTTVPTENLNTNPTNINTIMSNQVSTPQSQNNESVKIHTDTNTQSPTIKGFDHEDKYVTAEEEVNKRGNKLHNEQGEDELKAPNEKKKENAEADIRKKVEEELKVKEMKAELARLVKEKEEQADFILGELINTHVPRSNFKKDEEYESETNNIKGFLKKYGINYNDAKWFITKAYSNKTSENSEGEKKEGKKGSQAQYAGFMSGSSHTLFNTDELTESNGSNNNRKSTKPIVDEYSEFPIDF